MTDTANKSDGTKSNIKEPSDYVPYRSGDTDYFGAKDVVECELDYIRMMRAVRDTEDTSAKIPAPSTKNDTPTHPKDLVGLALSGGGIRSASFCLGVLQALSCNGWLKKVDYLSTVSGGGYIGTSLSWLLHKRWANPKSCGPGTAAVAPAPASAATETSGEFCFGLEQDDFPYGTYPIAGKAQNAGRICPRTKGAMLRFLRQNAKFLTPGNGITLLSLIAVVLRNSILSFVLHGAALVVLFMFFGSFLFYPAGCLDVAWLNWLLGDLLGKLNLPTLGALTLVSLFLASIPIYSILTWAFGLSGMFAIFAIKEPYLWRRRYEKLFRWVLIFTIIFAVLGSIRYVHDGLNALMHNDSPPEQTIQLVAVEKGTDLVEIKGRLQDAEQKSGNEFSLPTIIGFITTLFGLLSSITAFFQTNKTTKPLVPIGVFVALGAAALLFGVLLLAYEIYLSWTPPPWVVWALAGSVLLVAWLTNLNYVSVHRYYRDRLMETFMPQVEQVLRVEGGKPEASSVANRFRLAEMPGNWQWLQNRLAQDQAQAAKEKEKENAKPGANGTLPWSPYHIINTNLILASSKIPKFHGRGGDNFIFTPNYCGSNATGWARTSAEPFYSITLASAMAISGAAVNPDAGGGGVGITRQPVLATLMGLLNIRLGYWLPNPNRLARPNNDTSGCAKKSNRITKLMRCLLAAIRPSNPNFVYPGFGAVALHKNLSECSGMLQLSDGGHFENLGLYELVRRKAKLIIVCDGGADPKFNFDDLANAIEKIRVDFGALIDLRSEELEQLVSRGCRSKTRESDKETTAETYAERPFLVKTITYSEKEPDGTTKNGTLIYLTTTFFRELTADLYGYRRRHPQFPDEPTGDQFFDEKQFEAYRELGFQSACRMMNDTVQYHNTIKRIMPPAGGCCASLADDYKSPGHTP